MKLILITLFIITFSPLVNAQIQKSTIKADSLIKNNYSYLHFATHGFFEDDKDSTHLDNPLKRGGLLLYERNSKILDTIPELNYTVGEVINFNISSLELVVLSLVDKKLFENWNSHIENFKKIYARNDLLVVVSMGDSEQRSAFVLEFYKKMNNLAIEKAYLETITAINKKYGQNIDFKHYFHKAK